MPEQTVRHNQGTIRRRGSRWQVDTTIAGRRVRRAAPTYEAAHEILAELSSSNRGHNGTAVAARVNGVTLTEILQRYLQSTRLHCRPRTIRTSKAAVRRLTEFFGEAHAADLSRSDFDRYSAERMAQGVGPRSGEPASWNGSAGWSTAASDLIPGCLQFCDCSIAPRSLFSNFERKWGVSELITFTTNQRELL